MADILKQAADARKYSISLAHLEYGGDLTQRMKKHSSKLEHVYAKLQDLQKQGSKENARYEKFFAVAEHMGKWYSNAEAQHHTTFN